MAAAQGRISDVMLDRLALTPQRIEAMAKGIRDVAALPDPDALGHGLDALGRQGEAVQHDVADAALGGGHVLGVGGEEDVYKRQK